MPLCLSTEDVSSLEAQILWADVFLLISTGLFSMPHVLRLSPICITRGGVPSGRYLSAKPDSASAFINESLSAATLQDTPIGYGPAAWIRAWMSAEGLGISGVYCPCSYSRP